MITADLLSAITGQYLGRLDGVHGLAHWARVLENGRRLAAGLDVDLRVIELFAVFHDARRENEGVDPGHGARGADLARRLRGRCFDLDDPAMDLLTLACQQHTDGRVDGPLAVQVCWDADRLDLLRCAIRPLPSRLATEAARRPDVLEWACARAATDVEPAILRDRWRRWLR